MKYFPGDLNRVEKMIDDQNIDVKNIALCYASERGNLISSLKNPIK